MANWLEKRPPVPPARRTSLMIGDGFSTEVPPIPPRPATRNLRSFDTGISGSGDTNIYSREGDRNPRQLSVPAHTSRGSPRLVRQAQHEAGEFFGYGNFD